MWTKTKDQRPPADALIVKRWKNGAVWAGKYSGSEKDSAFDEWFLVEDVRKVEKTMTIDEMFAELEKNWLINPSELANSMI